MCQYSVFMENMKMKRKQDKKDLTFPDRDMNPGFLSKIPAQNLNFDGDQINRAHGS